MGELRFWSWIERKKKNFSRGIHTITEDNHHLYWDKMLTNVQISSCSWYFPYVVKQNFYNMSRTSFSVLIRYIHYSLLQVLCDGHREIVLQWSQRTFYFLACLETSERSDQKNLTPMIFYICSFAPKDVFPCNLSMESFFHLKGAFLGNHAVVLVR